MNEINLKMTSVVVDTKPKKLRCDWSIELVKDVSSFHNIDAEAELEKILWEECKVQTRRGFRKKKIENLTKHTA
jgi:hypothetical protein